MKMSMNIPASELIQLRELSNRHAQTYTDTVRRAIRVLKVLDNAQEEGKEILIRDPKTQETDRLVIL